MRIFHVNYVTIVSIGVESTEVVCDRHRSHSLTVQKNTHDQKWLAFMLYVDIHVHVHVYTL